MKRVPFTHFGVAMSHPPLSDDDKQFLRAILSNPAEQTAWLAYADWLDERDDPRAEFIRLEARFALFDVSQTERHAIAARLEKVRPTLDPNWVATFDRPPIENCDEMFAFRCPKKWEQLQGTDDPNVRHCASCAKRVYYCHSLGDAFTHARLGHCVAVACGVNRFPGDLTRTAARGVTVGRWLQPDPGPEHEPKARPRSAPTRRELEPPPTPPKPPIPRKARPQQRPWWKFW